MSGALNLERTIPILSYAVFVFRLFINNSFFPLKLKASVRVGRR